LINNTEKVYVSPLKNNNLTSEKTIIIKIKPLDNQFTKELSLLIKKLGTK